MDEDTEGFKKGKQGRRKTVGVGKKMGHGGERSSHALYVPKTGENYRLLA